VDTTQEYNDAAIGILSLLGIVLGFWTTWRPYPRRERQARSSVQQLADLKRAIDQAAIVATTDVSGRITYANDKFCEISGYSREELLGQDHRIVNSGYHSKEFIRDLWRTIASGRVWHGELRNRAKDGTFYWVNTTIVPFLNAAGKPYQYIAIRTDITSRKAAEERLAQQAALAQVGQMAAVVAHEVRNPLAGIKGAIQVMMSRRQPADAEVPVMRDVVARIDALSGLINDLMVFARPRPIQPSRVELRPLLAEAVTLLRRDPAGSALDVAIEGPDVTLTADAELLRSTVLNLMLNAAQAMAGRGRLTLTGGAADGRWSLRVRDTGPGIPPDIRDQVFEPFFTTKSRGGGLGLPIARRTAELHGGTLSLECPPGGGAAFTLTLPLRANRTDETPAASAAPAGTSRSDSAPGRG
jgi:two-component system CheB/CheR fusion protein